MPTLLSFLLRLFLVAGGLLLAASLAVAFVLIALVWGARSAWARLTGRPVMPFVMRIDPRAGFDRVYRRAQQSQGSRTPRADTVHAVAAPDITDVEARSPRP
jgi:hypothetical protein